MPIETTMPRMGKVYTREEIMASEELRKAFTEKAYMTLHKLFLKQKLQELGLPEDSFVIVEKSQSC